MITVFLNLRDKNTGKATNCEINPMLESWRRNPHREISDWITERGNPQHSTPKHTADLELVTYFVRHF